MAKSQLSDEQWQEIHARFLAGERLVDLDREFGFGDGNIASMLCRRFGYERKTRKPNMTWEQSDAIYQRLLAGESVSAIAKEIGQPNTANLYKLMRNRYGYEAQKTRRAVWGPTATPPQAATDLAYMAGIIDGEGSIMKSNRNATYPTWSVKVSMTDRPLIEWLHSFGGTFSVRPSRNPEKWKEQYCWTVSRQIDVQLLLTALLPHLRIKRDKALEALEFFRDADPFTRKWGRGNPRGAVVPESADPPA